MNATAQPVSTPVLRLFAVFWWLVFFGSLAVAGRLVDEWRSIDGRDYGFFYELELPLTRLLDRLLDRPPPTVDLCREAL